MREILFRGKLINGGQWTFGNLIEHFNGNCAISTKTDIIGTFGSVIPETVGEYTGLTDKNGKRIFEGDIVKDAGSYISVIKIGCCLPSEFYEIFDFEIFNKNNLKICAVYAEHVFGEYKGEHFLLPEKNSTIVIGNIHDNPELLEVQE